MVRVPIAKSGRAQEADAWETFPTTLPLFLVRCPDKAGAASSVGSTKKGCPTPYSEAQLDTTATTATPLTRREAVRFGAAADHL